MSDTEYTPLLDGSATLQAARKRATPLPRLQLFNVFFIQFAEPVTATVVYPFIVQLVRDTGITGGDEARTGYYAGLIVRADRTLILITNAAECSGTGIPILCR
jgi:hypothetical protein